MKKYYHFIIIALGVFLLLFPSTLYAGGKVKNCDTKYPVIFAHGTGGAAKILGIVDYWWGIPEALEEEGAEVYITTVNGVDSTVKKAAEFKRQFLQIKTISRSSQFNIIGHSHGAIYTRYAISNLGLDQYVKSHTSIAGPHHGMALADLIVYLVPTPIKWITGNTLNFVYAYIFGDTNPDSQKNAYDVTRAHMKNTFNPNTPDMENVYYQSWAAKAKYGCPNIILEPTWKLLLIYEGPNDGLVGVESARWGDFRGIEDAALWSPGCDHLNIIGHMFGITPGFDAPDFYVNIVSELKTKGY